MTSDPSVVTPSSSIADVLSIDAVLPRDQDLRPIRPEHVRMLAANIATVGLISPPAVDAAGRLLAGEHRREALLLLRSLSGNLDLAREFFALGGAGLKLSQVAGLKVGHPVSCRRAA